MARKYSKRGLANKIRGITVSILFGTLAALQAYASPITINPGAYTGSWAIAGVMDFTLGTQTVDLLPGTYNLYIGPSSSITVSIDSSGVTSVSDTAAVTHSAASILFNTVDVNVNVGTYDGLWVISHVDDFASGSGLRKLVPNMRYPVYLGSSSAFDMWVTSSGTVNVSNTLVATGGQNSLAFNTITLNVNPGAYSGYWYISNMTDYTQGGRTVTVAPGMAYDLYIGIMEKITLNVSSTGQVTSSNTTAVMGGMQSVTFNTVSVAVNPGNYAGYWSFSHATDYIRGNSVINLLPNLNYFVLIGELSGFVMSVGSTGAVTVANSAIALGGNKSVAFNSLSITINPGGYTAGWRLSYVTDYIIGSTSLYLVPGLDYEIDIDNGDTGVLSVAQNGTISQANISIDNYTFLAQLTPSLSDTGNKKVIKKENNKKENKDYRDWPIILKHKPTEIPGKGLALGLYKQPG